MSEKPGERPNSHRKLLSTASMKIRNATIAVVVQTAIFLYHGPEYSLCMFLRIEVRYVLSGFIVMLYILAN